MRYAACANCYQSVGWLGLVTNAILMVMKVFVGLVSGSQALLADAMYSAKDLFTSSVVIVGVHFSNKPLDREHPYGHGKIESILSLVVSVIFLLLTAVLLVHTIEILLDDNEHRTPHLIALWAALISVAINVFLYFYSRCVAIEANSPMVRTLAKHHHADASSSAAVVIGLVAAIYLDMAWIDTWVALFETIHLLYLGADVFRDAYLGLMDRNLDKRLRKRIAAVVESVDGVVRVGRVRGRHIGQEIGLDLNFRVAPETGVAAAEALGASVKEKLLGHIPHLGSIQLTYSSRDDESRLPAEPAGHTLETAESSK
jgi:cation diffusion facilitator family transporter